MLENFNIVIPKSTDKIEEWVEKISEPYNMKVKNEEKIKELENEIYDNIENEDCDEINFSDMCEYIKTGKNTTDDNKKGKLYPYYGTAGITGYTDDYLFDGKHLLISRNGTMGNCFITNGKIYPSDHMFVIKNKENYNIWLLYWGCLI
jgi:type I restriction enzyme S subunit